VDKIIIRLPAPKWGGGSLPQQDSKYMSEFDSILARAKTVSPGLRPGNSLGLRPGIAFFHAGKLPPFGL